MLLKDFYFDLLKPILDRLIEKLVEVLFIFVQFVENEEAVVANYFDFYVS